jgi:hypothetical protein
MVEREDRRIEMNEEKAVRAIGRGFERYPVQWVKQGWTFDGIAKSVYASLIEEGLEDEAQAFLDAAGLELGPRGGIHYKSYELEVVG